MMTIRLWRAVSVSRGISPLFKRAFRAQRRSWLPEDSPDVAPKPVPMFKRIIGLGIVLITSWSLVAGLACMLPFVMMILAAAGFYYGARFAMQTSIVITEERNRHTFDLLCVAPLGEFGICWTAFTGFMEQMTIMRLIYQLLRWLTLAVGTGTILILGLSVTSMLGSNQQVNLDAVSVGLRQGGSILGLIIGLYLHYTGSIVLGGLVGMWIPSYALDRLEAPVLAILIYGAVQIASYMLIYAIDVVYLPLWLESSFILPLLQFMVFCFIRDMIMRGMWYWMIHRLQAGTMDIQFAFSPSVSIS